MSGLYIYKLICCATLCSRPISSLSKTSKYNFCGYSRRELFVSCSHCSVNAILITISIKQSNKGGGEMSYPRGKCPGGGGGNALGSTRGELSGRGGGKCPTIVSITLPDVTRCRSEAVMTLEAGPIDDDAHQYGMKVRLLANRTLYSVNGGCIRCQGW